MQTTVEKFISLWHESEALIWVRLYRTVRKKGKLREGKGAFDWQGLMTLLNVCLCVPTPKHPDPRPLFLKTSWQLCWAMSSLPKKRGSCSPSTSFPPCCTHPSVSWRGIENPNFHVDGQGCLCGGSSTGCCPDAWIAPKKPKHPKFYSTSSPCDLW